MLKTLGTQIKEFKRDSILTPIFMILEVLMEMVIPLMMASIIDKGVEVGDMQHIYVMGGWMIVAAFGGLLAGGFGAMFGARAATGFARNLRKSMYENIQTFSFANIDKFSTAGLVTRMTTDVTNLQNAYQMILRMFVRAPFSLIIAMIMAFRISPRLASIYLIAVVVLGVLLTLIMTRTTKFFRQVFKKYDEKTKFTKANFNLYNMFVSAEKILVINMPLMQTAIYSCILLISWIGAKMIVVGDLTTGNLTSLLAYCMNILMSLMMLSMIFVMVTMSMASAERISEVLNEKTSMENPKDPILEVKDGSIEFRNVNFSYKQQNGEPVLKNINLSIKAGETIGIIGGTGSAKTSFVNLISRLYDVTEGEVIVGGKDVRTYDMEALRNQVSVVLQKNVLFSGSIYENLRWGDMGASEEECKRACKLACADEFIEKMPQQYETMIEQGGSNVSGGQKQRLCIARALLKKPKILILDDSTSAVDTATDAKIRKAFREEIPDTTKLIIAQRISSVQDADRIIVMENGEIHGFGTHKELLETNTIYRDVYESQTGGNGDFDEGGAA